MFKVTVKKVGSSEIWELEGKLSGDWVKEMRRCWSERDSREGMVFQVRLNGVSYIDAAGKDLLAEMYAQGVEILGGGCMTKAVVDEIVHRAGTNGRFERDVS